jgi:adenylate kinase
VLGPQGAGKGTQAARISEAQGIPWISTGEMFREAATEGTELGLCAKGYMERGDLVPDEVAIGVVRDRVHKPDAAKGIILDGFPRTLAQAKALDRIFDGGIDLVLSIDVPKDVALRRLRDRAHAEGRADDTPEAIERRLALYEKETRPLLSYYGQKVVDVNGVGSIDEVFERCMNEIEAAASR